MCYLRRLVCKCWSGLGWGRTALNPIRRDQRFTSPFLDKVSIRKLAPNFVIGMIEYDDLESAFLLPNDSRQQIENLANRYHILITPLGVYLLRASRS